MVLVRGSRYQPTVEQNTRQPGAGRTQLQLHNVWAARFRHYPYMVQNSQWQHTHPYLRVAVRTYGLGCSVTKTKELISDCVVETYSQSCWWVSICGLDVNVGQRQLHVGSKVRVLRFL